MTRHFSYWYPHLNMTGLALWGSPDENVIRQLNRVMNDVLSSHTRHIRFVDMRLVRRADPAVFRVMAAEYLASRWQRLVPASRSKHLSVRKASPARW